ncbi:serine hydrolase domain-containing protein [Streptomyces lichenis]|uniref:Beta-lactamase family protein n=1 Tax=Streptomyces lichenis TaxID=2306967 RepID=A0ABT0IFW6_9ACTN|nr:serine hydrolase domain-containing protein [Streptomyces lichenis]MCK8680160.1 beta-lactamase family protein [Streptomyces lichenis]
MNETLHAVIADGATPGGVLLTGTADGLRTVLAAGAVVPERSPEAPDEHTLYDLASLTKVVATWPLVGRAVEQGLLDIDAPLRDALPAMSGSTPSAEPTIRQILTHTSGMRATTRLDHYRGAELPLYELMCREPLDDVPGRAHRYINRGFVLLGLALAHVHGRPLDQLARELFDDLGMPATTYGPLARSSRVAPTEPRFPGAPRLWGAAHDDNAALLGGVAGHAGVFASAHDLATYAERLLDSYATADAPLGAWFRAGLVPQAEIEPGLHRGLAWVTAHGGHTAYHHGFTGTSLYLAPAAGRYLVITTNAIHNGPARTRLAPLRALALKVLTTG